MCFSEIQELVGKIGGNFLETALKILTKQQKQVSHSGKHQTKSRQKNQEIAIRNYCIFRSSVIFCCCNFRHFCSTFLKILKFLKTCAKQKKLWNFFGYFGKQTMNYDEISCFDFLDNLLIVFWKLDLEMSWKVSRIGNLKSENWTKFINIRLQISWSCLLILDWKKILVFLLRKFSYHQAKIRSNDIQEILIYFGRGNFLSDFVVFP